MSEPRGGLGSVQRTLLQALEQAGGMTEIDAGRWLHARRQGDAHRERFPEGQPCCRFCWDDGRRVLLSLDARGLVTRVDLKWMLTAAAAEVAHRELDERRAQSKLPGDAGTLRGLPAVGRGVAGAMRGTQPERETLTRERRRERRQEETR